MKANRLLVATLLATVLLAILSALFFARPTRTRRTAVSTGDPELDKFQGTWEFVSLEVNGQKTAEGDLDALTVQLTNHQWNVFEEPGQLLAQREFRLDPAGPMKKIDLLPGASGRDKRLLRGIYRFRGDKLTVCDRSEESGARPTRFASEPHSGIVLFVLQRLDP